NAAEGSEELELATLAMRFPRMAVFLTTKDTNGATGMSDMEGKTARVAASEAGAERVSMHTKKNGAGKHGGTTSVSSSDQLPNSRKIFVAGKIHPDIRVPFREINLAPTKTISGEIEVNEPVRVYDTSGPWGDPSVTLDPVQGLSALRRDWILKRGDVDEIEGRAVQPIDDGFLSEKHAASKDGNGSAAFNRSN